jgi:xylan 1,4-beta-xylosidase
MFARMSGQRLTVESNSAVPLDVMLKDGVRARPDVSALASLTRNKLNVMLWHYHDDDVPGPDADIELALESLPTRSGTARLRQFRIDSKHSNSFAAWQRMDSPSKPTLEQYARLEKAGQLATLGAPEIVRVKSGKTIVRLKLPRQAVSLLVLEWGAPSKR